MTADERYGPIIPVDGTSWGFRWEGIVWVLFSWVEVVGKDKVSRMEWDRQHPLYPVNVSHMAEIIARGSGAGATTALEVLHATIAERERLALILEEIIRQRTVTAMLIGEN